MVNICIYCISDVIFSPVTCFLLMEASEAKARGTLMILSCCWSAWSRSLKSTCSPSTDFTLKHRNISSSIENRSIHIYWNRSYLDLARRLFIFATFRERASFSSWLRSSSSSTSMSLFGMGTFCGVESWGGAEPRSITWFEVLKNKALKYHRRFVEHTSRIMSNSKSTGSRSSAFIGLARTVSHSSDAGRCFSCLCTVCFTRCK